ncbi:MAG: hypothetical protein JW863_02275 [Chitinispirillaceae bacterium]|nr:hypothetical protein [Chitinispirillaceae bacterium]
MTTGFNANWHPLTWLSHMLDYQLYGMWPGGHHLTNVFFHSCNTVLLFLVLLTATGTLWKSFLVAALFGLHPAHVESVAWISERKDVLSTFFGLAAIMLYLRYARLPNLRKYILVIFSFILSLMAKPTLVTLPLLLLLLDYWPLNRLLPSSHSGNNAAPVPLKTIILEKVPFLFFSIISSIITLIVQLTGGGKPVYSQFNIFTNFANAFLSYFRYLYVTFWPFKLSLFYPFPKSFPPLLVSAAIVGLILLSYLVIRFGTHRRWLIFGWFWYLVSLIPVIGFVKVGEQAIADRYTYIPLIGIFLVVAWATDTFFSGKKIQRLVTYIVIPIILIETFFLARLQISYWKYTITVFERVISVHPGLVWVYHKLAREYFFIHNVDKAYHYEKYALMYEPNSPDLHTDMGNIFNRIGQLDSAESHYREALQFNPSDEKVTQLFEMVRKKKTSAYSLPDTSRPKN